MAWRFVVFRLRSAQAERRKDDRRRLGLPLEERDLAIKDHLISRSQTSLRSARVGAETGHRMDGYAKLLRRGGVASQNPIAAKMCVLLKGLLR